MFDPTRADDIVLVSGFWAEPYLGKKQSEVPNTYATQPDKEYTNEDWRFDIRKHTVAIPMTTELKNICKTIYDRWTISGELECKVTEKILRHSFKQK